MTSVPASSSSAWESVPAPILAPSEPTPWSSLLRFSQIARFYLGRVPRRSYRYDTLPSSDDADDADDENDESDNEAIVAKHPRERRRRWVLHTTVWGLGLLATLIAFNVALFIWQATRTAETSPDDIFRAWGLPGSDTEQLAWYPTDFLRDVVPIPCHSHNDYWRNVPLFSALHAGCTGVEADVWLLDGHDDLYVGHTRAALQPSRTFRSLYVDPLVEILERQNKDHGFFPGRDEDPDEEPDADDEDDARDEDGNAPPVSPAPALTPSPAYRGVFDSRPEQSLILLVDVKTRGPDTLRRVQAALEPLRSRGWLTTYEDGRIQPGPVTVVGSGRTPFDVLMANSTHRDIFFDAPLHRLENFNNRRHYDATNSYYASVSIGRGLGTVWLGVLRQSQLERLRSQVRAAHDRGLQARYWDLPAWPISARNRLWNTLVSEGVDMLNVDDLASAAKGDWNEAGWF